MNFSCVDDVAHPADQVFHLLRDDPVSLLSAAEDGCQYSE